MNVYQLKYFIEVAKSLNISAAAKKLYISQQALSSQMKKIEEYYHVKLFERTPFLKLTDEGKYLYNEAVEMIDREEKIKRRFEEISGEESGEITVGISHTRGRVFLPLVMPEFMNRYPRVKIRLLEANSRIMQASLENGDIDILIDADNFSRAKNTIEFLAKERLFWIASEELCKKYDITGFSADDIKKAPLVLVNQNNRIRTIVDKYFDRCGISPNIVLESDNIETTVALAANSVGIAFYPEMFLNNQLAHYRSVNQLVYAPFDDRSTDYDLVIVYRTGRYLSGYESDFIRMCKNCIKQCGSVNAPLAHLG